MSKIEERGGLCGLALFAAKTVVLLYVILDSFVSPAVRPLLRWLGALKFMIRLEHIVAALPAHAVLLLLAMPLAFAEPAKIYALYLMGKGHFVSGLFTLAAAYFASLIVAERIYHAGRAKLRTIGWFESLMDWLIDVRDRFIGWIQATGVWILAAKLKQQTRQSLKKLWLRLRAS
ncbi:MAG TPA: hypothetical protein VFG05_06760 [Methylocella sp.]|nr:hypothetical protein [Methylocella sp.]